MVSSRHGSAGVSNTSQGGRVAVGDSGSAKLSTLSFSVTPQDRYVVTVKVFDGVTQVGSQIVGTCSATCSYSISFNIGTTAGTHSITATATVHRGATTYSQLYRPR